jgi:uncharacterized protein YjbI with pentapeptide repeats
VLKDYMQTGRFSRGDQEFDRADLSRARLSGANLVVLLSNMTRINFPFPLPGARSDIG